MNFVSRLIQFVIVRSLIAVPIILIAYFIIGVNYEHGDTNAGGMYPLVFAPHAIIIAVASYILYYLVDMATTGKKINYAKNGAHLVLGFGLLFFPLPSLFITGGIITLGVILLINLIASVKMMLT